MKPANNKLINLVAFIYKEYCLKVPKMIAGIILIILSSFFASTTFSQTAKDTTRQFRDELLNHLVGKWDGISIAHGEKFTLDLEAEWVMNHQYLHIHFKSREVVPWIKTQFESELFFGYNKMSKRYTVYEFTVFGSSGLYEGFSYGYRSGNEFKAVKKFTTDSLIISNFTWEPASGSWNNMSRWVIAGKEGEPFVEIKLVAAKSSAKKEEVVK